MVVPDPPAALRPRLIPWEAGRTFCRVHGLQYDATQFNWAADAEAHGRFHFFEAGNGIVVPVLYGAENADVAIAEKLFRNVPVGKKPYIMRLARLDGLALSRVTPKRDLQMIELLGHGLRRLGVTAEQLTATDAVDYPSTVAWAKRLHESVRRADGLVWMSRQFNAAQALMLFGDRVEDSDLRSDEPLPLSYGEGLTLVAAAASAADIIII